MPTISGALDARILSSMVDERDAASKVLDTPQISVSNRQEVIDDLEAALYASRVCSSAQGLYLIKAASDERKWKVDLAECARLWTAGSIIRSKMLHQIHEAFSRKPGLTNLIVEPFFAKELNKRSTAWRRLIATCVMNGIACPSLSGSLIYFDTYRRQRLPASLTQAQRDFFGNHTYERIDKDGRFHTTWTDEHKDSVVASERAAGENIQTDVEQTSEE